MNELNIQIDVYEADRINTMIQISEPFDFDRFPTDDDTYKVMAVRIKHLESVNAILSELKSLKKSIEHNKGLSND